jgi:ABC-2 type transport system permease protein
VRFFIEIFKFNLKIYFHYRWSFLISVITSPIILVLQIALFKTIYSYNNTSIIHGYTCIQMIWYFIARKFFFYLVWSYPEEEISENIVSGSMAIRLVQPLSLIKWEAAKFTALKLYGFFLEFLPGFFIYMLIAFPEFLTGISFLKYIIQLFLSSILLFLISFLLGTAAFKWQSITALQSLKIIVINFAAGLFIPLEFFPGIIQRIVKILPFQYLFYIPVRFLLNMPDSRSLYFFIKTVIIEIIWIILFYLLCKLALRNMVKYFSSVGG